MRHSAAAVLVIACAACMVIAADEPKVKPKARTQGDLGYRDTPLLPGQTWKVHDVDRPHPPVVTPGSFSAPERAAQPSSDAVSLFDGRDLSRWTWGRRTRSAGAVPRGWRIQNGVLEVTGPGESLATKENFGDIQLHVEWSAPVNNDRVGQWRSNSGIILMGRYEVQVLDSYDSATYPDGMAAALYGQWPPMVNALRPPGQWNVYDIIFEAPKFESGKMIKPAYATVLVNGVVAHHHREFIGQMAHRIYKPYEPHGPEAPLVIQNHDVPVRFRGIWVRRLAGDDKAPQ
ncbi:MAG TPA: DUF1080 domain-containing protein [Bryobacteraceae bacterium]|nr:DUF1080 domain-containing protein [Bryobacteraceae bacterium]